MASSHLHSIRQENGSCYHMFNLMFMNIQEIETLALALAAKPIPVDKIDILNNLKEHISQMHNNAMAKDSQPEKTPSQSKKVVKKKVIKKTASKKKKEEEKGGPGPPNK